MGNDKRRAMIEWPADKTINVELEGPCRPFDNDSITIVDELGYELELIDKCSKAEYMIGMMTMCDLKTVFDGSNVGGLKNIQDILLALVKYCDGIDNLLGKLDEWKHKRDKIKRGSLWKPVNGDYECGVIWREVAERIRGAYCAEKQYLQKMEDLTG